MIRVAVVGTGGISPMHIEGLLNFQNRCRIVALCDIYPEKAEGMKEKYKLDCEIFDDHQKMLSSGVKIDLVHICTPPYVHSEIAINSMNAGCHVVVEKPMATCLAECDAMLEAERKNGVVMACIAQNRFRNSIYKLKKIAESGIAGKIRCAHINSHWWRGHSYYDLWWRGTWEKEGGGPTLNHAVHHIDMLNWLEGELPKAVTALLANTGHDNSEVEDLSLAILTYTDGSAASITSSVIHHGEEQGIELQCDNAKISAPWKIQAEISKENGFPVTGGNQALLNEIQCLYDSLPDLPYEGHTGEIDDILRALEKGTKPLITGIDGRKTVELITAVYKAGSRREWTELPLQNDDPFYTFEGIRKEAIRFYEKKISVENFKPDSITVP